MTFLQRTLGEKYKWFYAVKYNFALANAGIVANIIRCIPKIISSLMILFIWTKANSPIELFTYLVIGRVYKSFCEGFGEQVVSADIISGSLTAELLRANTYLPVRFFSYCGRRILRNFLEFLTFTLVAVVSVFFFSPLQIPTTQSIFLLILFIPISFFVNFILGYIVGLFAFFINDKREFNSISDSWDATKMILYGLIIPLYKMPFHEFFEFLPTSYFLHHPMQIYLGKYNNLEILLTFLVGIAWCIVLLIMARLIFKAGLKHNEAVGL